MCSDSSWLLGTNAGLLGECSHCPFRNNRVSLSRKTKSPEKMLQEPQISQHEFLFKICVDRAQYGKNHNTWLYRYLSHCDASKHVTHDCTSICHIVMHPYMLHMTVPVSVTLWCIQTCYTCKTITVLLSAFNVSSHLIIKNLLSSRPKFILFQISLIFTIILREMSQWYISKSNDSPSVGPSE